MINLRKQKQAEGDASTPKMMHWICMDCHRAKRPAKFAIPVGINPKAGCPMCGSHQILDFNAEIVTLVVGGYG